MACQNHPVAMRSPGLRVPVLLLAVACAGCTQFNVRTRHDPTADFRGLHTFAWLPLSEVAPADQRVLDRTVDARIRAAADRELRAKGFAPAGNGAPDFFLNYRLASRPASSVRGDPSRFGWGTGWWVGWAGAEAIDTDSYNAGTLFLAVVDPRTKHMIWLGSADARLLPHISIEKRYQRVDAALHKIFNDFPPR